MTKAATASGRRSSDEFLELVVETHIPVRVVNGYRRDRADRSELRKSLRELVRVVKDETVRDMQQIPWADRPTRADSLLRRLWAAVKPPLDERAMLRGRRCRVCFGLGSGKRHFDPWAEPTSMAARHRSGCPIPEVTAYLTGGDER